MMFKRLRSKKQLSNEILALEKQVKDLEIIIENNNHAIGIYKAYYNANKIKNISQDLELFERIKKGGI